MAAGMGVHLPFVGGFFMLQRIFGCCYISLCGRYELESDVNRTYCFIVCCIAVQNRYTLGSYHRNVGLNNPRMSKLYLTIREVKRILTYM